jgi:hypothetical protein
MVPDGRGEHNVLVLGKEFCVGIGRRTAALVGGLTWLLAGRVLGDLQPLWDFEQTSRCRGALPDVWTRRDLDDDDDGD